ncbi:MAG: NAD-dependent epimerase/dehydratase family protein [Planctomycetes bacterium]|nr:NAD-dependent epimerase/dehydratase family protein [Planctomycetota bacterium]
MKVLVTGGGGFIGSAVSKYLLRNGLEVRVIDLVEPKTEGVEHICGSILDTNIVREAVGGCDAVIHLAAMLGVRKTEAERLGCLNINIMGTVNIIEACIKDGIKKIVLASSSEVYGEPGVDKVTEETELKPKSVYATTKIVSEEYLRAYNKRYGIDYSIVRFFNVYGIGQVAEFVLPRFVRAALDGKSPVVYGDGEQIRSFCYMNDAAQGIYLALTNEQANGNIFNIGNNCPVTMKGLAEKVIAASGKDLEVKHILMEESDRSKSREIFVRVPDISKARKVLSFSPQVSLDDGIRKLFDHGDVPYGWHESMNYTKSSYK